MPQRVLHREVVQLLGGELVEGIGLGLGHGPPETTDHVDRPDADTSP